eukprot:TRINITY_DN12218_c0_g2_i1.p1 TRINITY_DN12218_c0_g2~~TRINITY_DN12218_c0_g2_i1.p1  ORF type:complete len:587 (-),score=64.50 TRINITY_DN12218_c0_g2_i1:35-1735(-)
MAFASAPYVARSVTFLTVVLAMLPQSALTFRNTRSSVDLPLTMGHHVDHQTAKRSSLGMESDRDSAEIVVAETSPSQARGSSCAMQAITDAKACGQTHITSWISDATRCGMTTCKQFGRSWPCPKRCSTTTESPKTCNVAVSCPFRVRVNVEGRLFLETYETADFSIKYVNHRCVDCASEIQAISDAAGNSKLRSFIRAGVEVANGIGNVALQEKKAFLLEVIAAEILRSPAAYYIDSVGGNTSRAIRDLIKTIARDASLAFGEPKENISFFRHWMNQIRGKKSAASANSTQADSCRKWLRITSRNRHGVDGENSTVIIKEWEQFEIMRGYSEDGECVRTYVAQCSTSTVIDSWLCNTADPNTTQLELGGSGAILTISLPEGDTTKIFGHAKADYLDVAEVILDVVPAQTDEKIDPPVSVVIPKFKEHLARILCDTLAVKWWLIVRYPIRANCRMLIRTVLRFFAIGLDVPLPQEAHQLLLGDSSLHVDARISDGTLKAKASGINATILGANVGPLIEASLQNVNGVPIKIEESNIDIRFEDKSIIIEPSSWVVVSGSLDMRAGDR